MILYKDKAFMVGVNGIKKYKLKKYPYIKTILCPMTGTEHLKWIKGYKIISIKNDPILKEITSTSELAIWHILELLRRPHKGRYLGNQLKDKTMGIIGYGRLGKIIEKIAKGFQMKIITFDKGSNLEKILPLCDIISIHLNLDKTTNNFIKDKHFSLMKRSAIVINTARSQIISEKALYKAIITGKISGYGTDVVRSQWEKWILKLLKWFGYNISLSNHIGGNTKEARELTNKRIIEIYEKKKLNRNK